MARSERRTKRRVALAFAAAALGGLALVACNQLIGLDDFEESDCTGADCTDPNHADVVAPDGGVDASDAGVDAWIADSGPNVGPVSWARWPMTNRIDAGDASAAASPPPAFSSPGGDWLSDDVTKLIWSTTPIAGVTYEDAVEACAKLVPAARLPTRIELVTLIDPERPGFQIDESFAVSTRDGAYWTSSAVRPLTEPVQYWTVGFRPLGLEPREASEALNVRCVRGGA